MNTHSEAGLDCFIVDVKDQWCDNSYESMNSNHSTLREKSQISKNVMKPFDKVTLQTEQSIVHLSDQLSASFMSDFTSGAQDVVFQTPKAESWNLK